MYIYTHISNIHQIQSEYATTIVTLYVICNQYIIINLTCIADVSIICPLSTNYTYNLHEIYDQHTLSIPQYVQIHNQYIRNIQPI